MEGNHAGEPGEAASAGSEALVAREHAADERDRMAGDRDLRADERETAANQREQQADDREALADAREREADRREAAATERERKVEEREREFEEHGRALGAAVAGLEQRMIDTIERSRALLALSGERLDRQEEGVRRAQARRERQQAEVSRAAAETERKIADWMPDPNSLGERSKALRKRALAAMQEFASNEEETARLFQDLAASNPERREEFLDGAERARTSARSAREVLKRLTRDQA